MTARRLVGSMLPTGVGVERSARGLRNCRGRRLLLAGFFAAVAAAPAWSRTWIIEADPEHPEDQIGAACTAAASGDTILVGPGTYYEHARLGEKAITLRSRSGPNITILDGSRTFPDREGSILYCEYESFLGALTIDGFTFQNGQGSLLLESPYRYGGAIAFYPFYGGSMVTVQNCRFQSNSSGTAGLGGAYYSGFVEVVELLDCSFSGNFAREGMDVSMAPGHHVRIERCQVEMNQGEALNISFSIEALYSISMTDSEFRSSVGDRIGQSCRFFTRDLEFSRNRLIDPGGMFATRVQLMGFASASPPTHTTIEDNVFLCGDGLTQNLAEGVLVAPDLPSDMTLEGNTFAGVGLEMDQLASTAHLLSRRNIFYHSAPQFMTDGTGQIECNDSWPDTLVVSSPRVVVERNIRQDPLLCVPAEGDLRIAHESPCTPEHNPFGCERIGALEAGCHISPTVTTSWGRIKSMYRRKADGSSW